ncbi:putative Phosphoenolpyruvate carboxylase [Blattamonas nauphoetae]|uniref:phosphoenolpyruvate carboxylase n=1 Tax=Blattamonas nauphoetae TaxID=2049346 RepID=A0ABQ9XE09_9EUKA|nr:putative Phosphoenolpyruvate carboxylase [Blattamonas nauphoetae]
MNCVEDTTLPNDIQILSKMLDETIEQTEGPNILYLVNTIKRLSGSIQDGDFSAQQNLIETLQNLKDEEFLPVTRALSQYMNLINTVEQYHSISPNSPGATDPVNFTETYHMLQKRGIADTAILATLCRLSINLVLTAHPTEVNRQSLNNNLLQVDSCLSQLDHSDLPDNRKRPIIERLRHLISQYWYTNKIRQFRPTPNEEAKWGVELVTNSLWTAVPDYLRRLDLQVQDCLDMCLPVDFSPISFSSWMGGDRDGNTSVTAVATREILLENRLAAARLFADDFDVLVWEMSMWKCTDSFREYIGDYDVQEPYRELMRQVRAKLGHTITYFEAQLRGEPTEIPSDIILEATQLWEPLMECYRSLVDCGLEITARGKLLDTMRRVKCFGMTLMQTDIRQHRRVHTEALSEITRFVGLGDYSEWSEAERMEFLISELNSNRPLLPYNWNPSQQTQEVLDTMRVISETGEGVIPTYIVSATHAASDVLAVHLLLRELECPYFLPVTPLFEPIDDLRNAANIISQLLQVEWYRNKIGGRQMVMIDYSDSSKDAGSLAASWAQYCAQEDLLKVCSEHNVQLKLCHGRGGTVGRGGGPAKFALFSQPPGTLRNGLRVTEQGEMMRFKLGTPEVAIRTFSLYSEGILEANLIPPPVPKQEWRSILDDMAEYSQDEYQSVVYEHPSFVPYFYQTTPVTELAVLPLSSRPFKYSAQEDVESLHAIPWVFGWTQNRLLLPAWLGAGTAMRRVIDEGKMDLLREMREEWPFFTSFISILEMVYAKANTKIAKCYDEHLVDESLRGFGQMLRETLQQDISTVDQIHTTPSVCRQSSPNIAMRTLSTDPLNLLQIELLTRTRNSKTQSRTLQRALMITISGIAAGMRNTG